MGERPGHADRTLTPRAAPEKRKGTTARARRIAGRCLVLLTITLTGLSGDAPAATQSSALDAIRESGVLRVGTTGDYRPFSYRRPEGGFEGLDIDAARELAASLGVELRFVAASWPRLLEGLEEGRYDIAMTGATRTSERAKRVSFTRPYFELGKCPLVRARDRGRFTSLESIDVEGIRIGVNPGGTNEAFVRSNFERATIVVIEENLDIPDAVAKGRVDVMITDNVEARLVAAERPELAAVSPETPFNQDELAYMLRREDPAFLSWLDRWLEEMESSGKMESLRRKWIPADR